jgi:hypothetical protein
MPIKINPGCKYCHYFRYLSRKIPTVDMDGWCIRLNAFTQSDSRPICEYYFPRPLLVIPSDNE